jgi:hypothetical protein
MNKILPMSVLMVTLGSAWLGLGSDQSAKAGKKPPTGPDLMRADFRDSGDVGSPPGTSYVDRIQWDSKIIPSCLADYVDFDDPCGPGHRGVISHGTRKGGYLLRTVNLWDPTPERWLVFDFTDGVDGSGCQDLDEELLNYPGRNPAAVSPYDASSCVDLLEVRFWVSNAFTPGAEYAGLNIVIDGPDLIPGRGKKKEDRNQWNAKWYLNPVNPLKITHTADPNTVILTTMDGLEQAELWTVNQQTGDFEELLGTYWMPFQVTLTRLP